MSRRTATPCATELPCFTSYVKCLSAPIRIALAFHVPHSLCGIECLPAPTKIKLLFVSTQSFCGMSFRTKEDYTSICFHPIFVWNAYPHEHILHCLLPRLIRCLFMTLHSCPDMKSLPKCMNDAKSRSAILHTHPPQRVIDTHRARTYMARSDRFAIAHIHS